MSGLVLSELLSDRDEIENNIIYNDNNDNYKNNKKFDMIINKINNYYDIERFDILLNNYQNRYNIRLL
jgi:hypothetical protein